MSQFEDGFTVETDLSSSESPAINIPVSSTQTSYCKDRCQMPNDASVLEISTAKQHLQSLSTGQQRSFGTSNEMVFPHNKFPSFENSSLHISAMEGENNINFLKKGGMKRPSPSDCSGSSAEKRKRMSSTPFFMKEELSEADFQMSLLKESLATKKNVVYQHVLEQLGLQPTSGKNASKKAAILPRTTAEHRMKNNHLESLTQYGRNSAICFKRSCDGNKVHDEEGNCYIDEDDFKCFYRPKEEQSGQFEAETVDTNDYKYTTKRNLNFTFHGKNGGVAIDHQTLPKVIGIHSVPRKGNHGKDHRSHIEAKLVGSSYKTAGKPSPVEKCTVKEEKWWPPSPESIPDEMTRDGEGLLKVMTLDEMKAYGLPKKENQENAVKLEQDDVVVTQVVKRGADNESPRLLKADLHNMPPLQLDADGKPSNYKEILLHYITHQIKKDPQNPSLNKITKNAVAGRQKTMNMDELCKKLMNTREKLEHEQMVWKRKLLSSLEVVLIKKIRKLELETGENAPEGINLQGVVKNEQSNGSQSDIVAVMEDLTGDVNAPRSKKITTSSRSVAAIRGYESS